MLEVLKSSNKAIGIKQTIKAVEKNMAAKVYIARDADEKVTASLKNLCITNAIELEYIDTMKQLGRAVGIEVGASAVCVLKR